MSLFAKRLGLIAWLRESMSRRNPSIEMFLFQKWRKKLRSLIPHVRRPGKAVLDEVGI